MMSIASWARAAGTNAGARDAKAIRTKLRRRNRKLLLLILF
jgi:hypothetical protein